MSHFCGVAMEDVMLISENGKGYIRVNENGRVVADVKENCEYIYFFSQIVLSNFKFKRNPTFNDQLSFNRNLFSY